MRRRVVLGSILILSLAPVPALAQQIPPGSANVRLQSHLPLGGDFSVGDVEIEQELSRPYVYVTRTWGSPGFDLISVKNPARAQRIYSWQIENPELHLGLGGSDGQYFKHRGRYFYAESFQFVQGGPDADLGAVIFDVTGLPDTSRVRETLRLRTTDLGARWGGFHTLSPYRHSDGRVLLFATNAYIPGAAVYDLGKLVDGQAGQAPLAKIPGGQTPGGQAAGYHDFYLAYDPATHQDKFYGAGLAAGYFVYDVTRPEEPRLITSITGVAGLAVAHTFQVTPDGRYGMTQMEYQYAPVRIFDLKPGLDGTVKTISRPIGAWAGNWRLASHNHEIRWPYVFIASFADGLQILNMMDPANPYTVGRYDTHSGSLLHGLEPDRNMKPRESNSIFDGGFGIDVRNADGLIVVSDIRTGFWSFKLDGFDGWNGHRWGMPNISSEQDWDYGPEGAPKAGRVS